MSNKNILELPDKKLKELFQEVHPGSKYPLIDTEDIDLALEYYKDKFIIPYQALSITPSEDYKYLQAHAVDIIKDTIMESFRDYPKQREAISKLYQETKDWDKVITTEVYRDVDTAQEAFIDEVEEVYNTKVKDAKHLQKLTGISEDKGETLEELEETLNTARYSKYFRALYIILKNGGTYSDLLQVEPKDYDLPETWEGTLGKDKLTTIYWAVGFHYNLIEPGLSLLPNIRFFTKYLKAPFSFIMDVYTYINRINKEDAIKEILK